ncbi:hypothetical protein ACFLS1_01680 [Verrucomicrobiota bacterium]
MNNDRAFTNVDDEALVQRLRAAQSRVTFVAPGISKLVAGELIACLERIPVDQVNVILDVDPEVCRLGYGDIEGLELLKIEGEKHGLMLCHQPGIRLGLLIADDTTVIYSPTPLLIEAGSTTPTKPNGICISGDSMETVKKACGVEGSAVDRELGMDPAKTPDIEMIKQDLERNPPKRFDVARAERVFNSRLQYVEFSFEDYKLSKKTISIPAELTGITQDKDLIQRWRNSFRLFSGTSALEVVRNEGAPEEEFLTEQGLETEKKAIVSEFLLVVPRFGTVILRSRRNDFDKRIEVFKERVEAFKKGVVQQVEEHLLKTKESLIGDLISHVKEKPPEKWRKTMPSSKLSDTEAKERLQDELEGLFGSVERVFDPKVRIVFKEVTYESISDSDFQASLTKHFPPTALQELFSEHDAAPEATREEN